MPCQVQVLKRENGRLANECNQLHQQLIQEGDQQDRLSRERYQETKRLEAELSELNFWKQQTLDRVLGLERENQGLKRHLQLSLHGDTEFPSGEPVSRASQTQIHESAPDKSTLGSCKNQSES